MAYEDDLEIRNRPEDRMTALAEYLRKHNLNDWATTAAHLAKLPAENEALLQRIKEAEAANELDRSRIPKAISALNVAVRSRDWVLEGRGPDEWDDDDYRAEFSEWVEEVSEAVKLFVHIAADWHGCPIDPTEIRHARAALNHKSN